MSGSQQEEKQDFRELALKKSNSHLPVNVFNRVTIDPNRIPGDDQNHPLLPNDLYGEFLSAIDYRRINSLILLKVIWLSLKLFPRK